MKSNLTPEQKKCKHDPDYLHTVKHQNIQTPGNDGAFVKCKKCQAIGYMRDSEQKPDKKAVHWEWRQ